MVSNDSDDIRSTHRRAPVIGLTTYLEQAKQGVWDVQAAFLPHVYFDAVSASGGVAVLLPPQPNAELAASVVLDGLDGLILTGGKDVQPELYGAERHPLTDDPRAGPRRLGARSVPRRRRAAHSGARHLPWLPARERGARRHPASAPARGAGHRAVPGRRWHLRVQLRRDRGGQQAGSPRRTGRPRRPQLPPPGRRPAGRRSRGDRAHRRRTPAGVRIRRGTDTCSESSGIPSRTSRTAGSSPGSSLRHRSMPIRA